MPSRKGTKGIYRREKKEEFFKCNGTNVVKIKTIHGQFMFPLQKYQVKEKSCHYFDLTSQLTNGYTSPLLQEFVAYYSNRLSYQEVEKLVKRVTGAKLLSDQKIWEIVVAKAEEVSEIWIKNIKQINQKITSEIQISEEVEAPEILLFDDGIGVKEQKAKRISLEHKKIETGDNIQKKSKKIVLTDVVLLQTPTGRFEYLTSPIDKQGKPLIPLEQVVKSQLKYYYHKAKKPLALVAITDGASNIRKRLTKLGDGRVTVILDWYHLRKKVREFLSMIARNKAEKKEHSHWLLYYLWRGQHAEAMYYLTTQIQARNEEKLLELLFYLSKHEYEIINYDRRRQAGKSIGSGRMEKAVDVVIGHRQKHKGTRNAFSWK